MTEGDFTYSKALDDTFKEMVKEGKIKKPAPKTHLQRWNEAEEHYDLRRRGFLALGDLNPMEERLREQE